MNNIEVEKIIEPVAASDGAGVKLKRSIGTHLIDYHDPFLMLDEFGSENKDDYIGGFPPHPHRGIETVTYMLAGDFEHKDSTGGRRNNDCWRCSVDENWKWYHSFRNACYERR